jgi:uncharacterized membrane protein
MRSREPDPEIVVLVLCVIVLTGLCLWMGSQPQFPQPLKGLPLVLGIFLAVIGAVAVYGDPHLESRWAFWLVLAKDIAIGIACLMLGLVLGCG